MLVVAVIALGCLILGTIDGFAGVLLWAVLAPILCIVLDLLLRTRKASPFAPQVPVDETRPAKLSAGLKPGMIYARIRHRRPLGSASPPFVWQSEAHQKRSEQESRASRRVRNSERRRER